MSPQQTHLLAPTTEFRSSMEKVCLINLHTQELSTHRLQKGRLYRPLNAITFLIFGLHLLMNGLLAPLVIIAFMARQMLILDSLWSFTDSCFTNSCLPRKNTIPN